MFTANIMMGLSTFGYNRRSFHSAVRNAAPIRLSAGGLVMRRFRTLPIGSKPVWLELAIERVLCLICGVLRQVKVSFASWRRSYTRAFERYALELSRHMTIKDVARHLGVSWDVIKDIQKRSLKRRFARPKLHKLKQIAIDEISIGKGHRYLTIVLDLESGAVVFVGEGKGTEALEPLWPRLKGQKVRIEAVATDLSPAYISAELNHLPNAVHVFDHFHIIKPYNEGLSDLRRKLYHEATHVMDQEVLNGTRWLLLKNPENLDSNRSGSRTAGSFTIDGRSHLETSVIGRKTEKPFRLNRVIDAMAANLAAPAPRETKSLHIRRASCLASGRRR